MLLLNNYASLVLLMACTNTRDCQWASQIAQTFQSVMHPLFSDLPNVESFIDDIGIFSLGSFPDHISQIYQVLLRLERNGFIVNPLKCDWAVTTTEYLGFLLTSDGIKPLPHKIKVITNTARPTSTKHI